MKKILQGTALAVLATVALIGARAIDVSAAEFPISQVHVTEYDYDYIIDYLPNIIVDVPEGCKEIMFGIATYNSKNNSVKIADNAWSVYDENDYFSYYDYYYDDEDGNYDDNYDIIKYVSIDLSKLSLTKDNYIAIKSESHTPIYIKIGASITSQTVEYNAGNNTIAFTINKSLNDATVENTIFEYRTPYGNWNTIPCYKADKNSWTVTEGKKLIYNKDAKVFKEYQHLGSTLYIRASARFFYNNAKLPYTLIKEISGGVKDANDKSGNTIYKLYNGGFMPGKESKLTIVKKANGPSVSADYAKCEVNIPANTQYRVLASGGAFSATEENTTKVSAKVSQLLARANGTTGTAMSGTLEVRRVARGTKTPSSTWTRIEIQMQEKIVAKTGFNENKVMTVTDGAVTVAQGITIKPIEKTTNTKGYSGNIDVTVDTSVGYSVNVQVGSAKATVVKNDGTAKKIKANAGEVIKIAVAGDKKSKIWASEYTAIGKIQ